MGEAPFLDTKAVAALGGVQAATVSRYRQRSKPGGSYESDPFPEPDGKNGKWPWWNLSRAEEIREWFARQQNRSGVGGRPRKSAGRG